MGVKDLFYSIKPSKRISTRRKRQCLSHGPIVSGCTMIMTTEVTRRLLKSRSKGERESLDVSPPPCSCSYSSAVSDHVYNEDPVEDALARVIAGETEWPALHIDNPELIPLLFPTDSAPSSGAKHPVLNKGGLVWMRRFTDDQPRI
jgi:hypothetical protein